MNESSLKTVIKELENLFQVFNSEIFSGKLLKPIITIQSGVKENSRGWFHANIWKTNREKNTNHEINIGAEILTQMSSENIPQVAVTLLHEMVHLYNYENQIKDVSENGYHHKKNFGKTAEKSGLLVEYIGVFPGCITSGLNLFGKEVFLKSKFNSDILDLNRINLRSFNTVIKKGKVESNPESEEDSEEQEAETKVKKSKMRSLTCKNCDYKVQVAFGFKHELECKTCNSTLVNTNVN